MWDDTIVVVMGDNGGPLNNGHDNGPFRGGKLNWWEGGVRPFAFISSPLLRSSPLPWELVHVGAGSTKPVDITISGHLQGHPHREALIADNILRPRSGPYQLIAGGRFNQTSGDGWQRLFEGLYVGDNGRSGHCGGAWGGSREQVSDDCV